MTETMNNNRAETVRAQDFPFRIQGINARNKSIDFQSNKGYVTFDDAERAAITQVLNANNIANGNNFIIYQAIAVVHPSRPPIETTMLEQSNGDS